MKIEALDHPKTFDFAARLNVSRPTAIGHLELLWAFIAQKTPRGDVGKWPNGAIARAADWMGPPDDFVGALVGAGFLDEDPEYRLLVHDWVDHCPNWVRAKMKKEKVDFALKSPLKSVLKSPLKSGTYEPSSRADLNQAKPNQAKPSQVHNARAPASPPQSQLPAEPTQRLSEDFDLFLRETYPETSHPADFMTAWHSAQALVAMGEASEAELRERLIGFRAFADSGGYSGPDKTPTPQVWFALHRPKRYWAQRWGPVPSKAQKTLDQTVSAGLAFLQKTAAGG